MTRFLLPVLVFLVSTVALADGGLERLPFVGSDDPRDVMGTGAEFVIQKPIIVEPGERMIVFQNGQLKSEADVDRNRSFCVLELFYGLNHYRVFNPARKLVVDPPQTELRRGLPGDQMAFDMARDESVAAIYCSTRHRTLSMADLESSFGGYIKLEAVPLEPALLGHIPGAPQPESGAVADDVLDAKAILPSEQPARPDTTSGVAPAA